MRIPSDIAGKQAGLALEATSFVVAGGRRILQSSEGFGWPDIAGVLCESLVPDEENTYRAIPHVLVACPFVDVEFEASVNGRELRGVTPAGSISIIPPQTATFGRTLGPQRTCHAYLDMAIVREVAQDVYGRNIGGLDVRSAIGVQGTALSHLMLVFNDVLSDRSDGRFRGEFLARAIAAEVLTKHAQLSGALPTKGSAAPFSQAQFGRVREFMEGHLRGEVSAAEIASSLGLSRAVFFRRFAATAHCTPNQYLQALRIERAKQLLRRTSLSAADVAAQVGYADQSHMARFFKRYVGVPAGAYRRAFWGQAEE